MIKRDFIVRNKTGLHARPAAVFVQTTYEFSCQVRVQKEDQEVDGKSVLGILTLAAENGAKLTITADGDDEEALMEKLKELFEKGFDEE